MTRYLTLRTHDRGGAVHYPHAVDCDPAVQPLAYLPVRDEEVPQSVENRHVVLAIHGFNVSRPHGVTSLGGLETALNLPDDYRFFGVLWPGDFWLPVVDYPWEAGHAVTAGQKLAAYVEDFFGAAASVSIISHSLGGRVLLETVQNLKSRRADQLCITAGAVDRDCMEAQYLVAKGKAGRIAVLSSKKDQVLKLAYPAGDFISDVLLGDNDSPWTIALGLKGPRSPILAPLIGNAIPVGLAYDHGDYFPPSDPVPPGAGKWSDAVKYMRRIVTNQDGAWPP